MATYKSDAGAILEPGNQINQLSSFNNEAVHGWPGIDLFGQIGFIKVSKTMETSVPGIYAAGDCLTLFRSVANAVAAGNKAGATINKQFISEAFELPEVKIIE